MKFKSRYCPACKQVKPVALALLPDFDEKYSAWNSGQLIQTVWPNAPAIQREQLQTGICSDKCWNNFLGFPNEEDDDESLD